MSGDYDTRLVDAPGERHSQTRRILQLGKAHEVACFFCDDQRFVRQAFACHRRIRAEKEDPPSVKVEVVERSANPPSQVPAMAPADWRELGLYILPVSHTY